MALPSLEYRAVPLDQAEVWLAELETEGFTVVAAVAGDQVLCYLVTTLRSVSVKCDVK